MRAIFLIVVFISFFFPKQKIGSGYIGTFYLPVAILSSVLSRCVMQLLYSVGVFFFSSSSICFLHPILVCKRLNNLLHVLLTENSLRKTPLIATLFNLLPFLSIFLFYFSFIFHSLFDSAADRGGTATTTVFWK